MLTRANVYLITVENGAKTVTYLIAAANVTSALALLTHDHNPAQVERVERIGALDSIDKETLP